MTDRARISAQLDPDLDRQIRLLAAELGIRPSTLIRDLLRIGLANHIPRNQVTTRIVENPFGTFDG